MKKFTKFRIGKSNGYSFLLFFLLYAISNVLQAQTQLYFQGGEGTANDNWPYTSTGASAAVSNYAKANGNKKTGTTSLAVGGNNSSGGSCISGGSGNGPKKLHQFTFSPVDISSTQSVVRTLSLSYGSYHPACNGTGWDSGEDLIFTPIFNGVAQAPITIRTGSNNLNVNIKTNSFTFAVPIGITSFSFRIGITTNRQDEHLYIDDVLLIADELQPVTLLSFRAIRENNAGKLYWSTSSEQKNLGFEIEKSTNGIDFVTIGFVEGNGNSNNLISYSFTDYSLSETVYYRLKQIDTDGAYEYSPIVQLRSAAQEEWLRVYPVPVSDLLTIDLLSEDESSSSVELYNAVGQRIAQYNFDTITAGVNTFQLDVSSYNPGIYFLTVVLHSGKKETKTIKIIQ
jgi:hypothetical protein